MQRERPLQPEVVDAAALEPAPRAPLAPESSEHPGEEHIHLAPQSIWPITTAAGVTLAGAGLVTALIVSFVGLAIMVIGIYYWVQELRHELH